MTDLPIKTLISISGQAAFIKYQIGIDRLSQYLSASPETLQELLEEDGNVDSMYLWQDIITEILAYLRYKLPDWFQVQGCTYRILEMTNYTMEIERI